MTRMQDVSYINDTNLRKTIPIYDYGSCTCDERVRSTFPRYRNGKCAMCETLGALTRSLEREFHGFLIRT